MGLRDTAQGLYNGTVSYNFVGNRKRWYIISGVILTVTMAALVLRPLNMGIEFRGGAEFQVPVSQCTIEEGRTVTQGVIGGTAPIVTQLGDGQLRIQTEEVTPAQGDQITKALGSACQVTAVDIKIQLIGPTWGADVSKKALQGLIVFLILVSIFLAVYFEWRMAVAALIALAHDLIITIGVYALVGFEVTPATAIGVLTILGFSLYDTVVVFDKVKENTRGILGQSRQTYSEAANLAVNQTLVRSINTSIVALLPVGAILFVGAGLLGAGTLKDLALALFVGMAAGAYSSICVATPILVQMKNREPEVQALERRVMSRRKKPDADADIGDGIDGEPVGAATNPLATRTVAESGVRNQPKRQPRSQRKS